MYPDNWQIGEWYVRQPDGTYIPAADQNPRADAIGEYRRYDGRLWDIVGRCPASDPNEGNAVPPGEPPPGETVFSFTRDNGTTYTVKWIPYGSPLDVPSNAIVVPEKDGDPAFIVVYNDDGSSWNPTPGSWEFGAAANPFPQGTSFPAGYVDPGGVVPGTGDPGTGDPGAGDPGAGDPGNPDPEGTDIGITGGG